MKRIGFALYILPVIVLFSGDLIGQSCPKGVRYNCVWGCGRHTDLNNDGFCDYSFITVSEKTVAEVPKKADSVAVAVADTPAVPPATVIQGTSTDIKEPDHQGTTKKTNSEDEISVIPSPGKQIDQPEADPEETSQGGESSVVIKPPEMTDFVPAHHGPVYRIVFLSILTLSLYFTTLILHKRNIIKRIHHRKIWNLLLLLTFLVSCLFGLFLVIQINYHIAMGIYGTLLLWHVEVGIAMTLIAIIHILWHLTYFKNMLKKW